MKELDKDECKLKRICRQIKNNAKLNNIEVGKTTFADIIEYRFSVLYTSKFKRFMAVLPFSVRFHGDLNISTCTLTIGNVEEHLFDQIYEASKKLFADIDGLTVVIEKDFC